MTPVLKPGYAASGKTTLSNLLLRSEPGLRTGVIAHRQVEEYGIAPHPIALDGCAAYDEVYDFGSGCICCSPSGELTRLLQAWADRLHEGTLSLDLLIIKAAPLASALVFAKCLAAASGRVGERFSLASIVAVVSPGLAVRHLAADGRRWLSFGGGKHATRCRRAQYWPSICTPRRTSGSVRHRGGA